MFTMSPDPCSTMPSIAAWVMYIRPRTLVDIIRRQSSVSAPTIVPSSITPALFTRTSRPPSSSRVRLTAARHCSSSVTSRSSCSTVAPSSRSLPASASSRSRRRAPMATAAPAPASAIAGASPIPDDAPVTRATFPASGRSAPVMRASSRTATRGPRGALCPGAPPGTRDLRSAGERPGQHRPLQEHDRLRVDDPGADQRQRLVDVELDHLDVLALLGQPASVGGPGGLAVRAGVAVQSLGDRTRAGVDVEHVGELADPVTGLLLGLPPGRGQGVVLVEETRRGLQEHAVRVAVDVGGEPELPGE